MNRLYKVDIVLNKTNHDFKILPRSCSQETMLTTLQELSSLSRGKWRAQLQHLTNAKATEISGPYLFSGGVMAVATSDYFIFYRQEKTLHLSETKLNPLFILVNSEQFKSEALKKCPTHFKLGESLTKNSRLIPYPRWKKILSQKKSLALLPQVRYLGIV